MADADREWRAEAFTTYRIAWSALLAHVSEATRPDVEVYIEELKEALLDLKQACVASDAALARRYNDEVRLLLAELRLKWGDK